MQLLDLKYGAFGLDISDASIKILKLLKKGNKFSVASFGETPLAEGIVESGIIRNEKALTDAIKNAIKSVKGAKLKAQHAVISLPEEETFLQVIQMPKMSEEELKTAITYEAENYIPIPISQVYLDFQIIVPIKNDLDHSDVLVAAAPKEIVDSYVSCVAAAGITALSAELESQSIARALIKNETSESPVALINIGARKVEFLVFSGRAVRFTSSIPVPKNQPAEVILEELLGKVKKYIEFYQEHALHEHLYSESAIKKILLAGQGSNLKELSVTFTQKIGVTTEVANPFVNCPLAKNATQNIDFLPFTTAIGSALGGIIIENQ